MYGLHRKTLIIYPDHAMNSTALDYLISRLQVAIQKMKPTRCKFSKIKIHWLGYIENFESLF